MTNGTSRRCRRPTPLMLSLSQPATPSNNKDEPAKEQLQRLLRGRCPGCDHGLLAREEVGGGGEGGVGNHCCPRLINDYGFGGEYLLRTLV